MKHLPWTDDLIHRALQLRREAWTFQAIADTFGPPFTKNAVISKLRPYGGPGRAKADTRFHVTPRTLNRPIGDARTPTPAYPGSKIDPDTGRDPALYPLGSDEWDTEERGRITINGVIWATNKNAKPPRPFVGFSSSTSGYMYTPYAWCRMMETAKIVRTAEDRIREAGEMVPKWAGPPVSSASAG